MFDTPLCIRHESDGSTALLGSIICKLLCRARMMKMKLDGISVKRLKIISNQPKYFRRMKRNTRVSILSFYDRLEMSAAN